MVFCTLSIVRGKQIVNRKGDTHDTCDMYHLTQDTQEMATIVFKQGQSNQCRIPGVKLESQSKSLKIINNLEKRKTEINKGEPKRRRNSNK